MEEEKHHLLQEIHSFNSNRQTIGRRLSLKNLKPIKIVAINRSHNSESRTHLQSQ